MRRGEDFPELLESPGGCRVAGDIDVHEPSAAHIKGHEDIQYPERRGHRHAEVAGNQSLGMVPGEDRAPVAGRALPSPAEPAAHGAADGARRDADSELHEEFCGDPLLAPGRIVAGHLSQQVAEGDGQSRAPDAGPPAPEEAERLPVPADQGCRLDARERFPPGEAPRQQDPRDAHRGFIWRSRYNANCFRSKRFSATSAVPKNINTSPPSPSTTRLRCPHPSIVRIGKNAPLLPFAGSAAMQIHSRLGGRKLTTAQRGRMRFLRRTT